MLYAIVLETDDEGVDSVALFNSQAEAEAHANALRAFDPEGEITSFRFSLVPVSHPAEMLDFVRDEVKAEREAQEDEALGRGF